jgi:hypothetical protein
MRQAWSDFGCVLIWCFKLQLAEGGKNIAPLVTRTRLALAINGMHQLSLRVRDMIYVATHLPNSERTIGLAQCDAPNPTIVLPSKERRILCRRSLLRRMAADYWNRVPVALPQAVKRRFPSAS